MSDDYNAWFQRQVRRGLQEADDPKTEWVSHDPVKADMASQRAALQRRIEGMGGVTHAVARRWYTPAGLMHRKFEASDRSVWRVMCNAWATERPGCRVSV